MTELSTHAQRHGRRGQSRPRVGFLGVGWIGRQRMEAILETAAVDVVAIADPSSENLDAAARSAPGAAAHSSADALMDADLDGVVIATPSALHARQAIQMLERGIAVFCQKPLGRDAAETRAVVESARRADRLLCVDLSYRFTLAMQAVKRLVQEGALGRVFAVDLVFHNAYGPDKAWFYDRALSGGGCVIDLGVHLVDLALWVLDFPAITTATSSLRTGGEPLAAGSRQVEDYAVAMLELAGGTVVRLACSWNLQAGCDAEIGAAFYGGAGGAAMHNVAGSFFELSAHHYQGRERREIARPGDPWPGRAAADWAKRLAGGERFSREAEHLVIVADALDRIYAASVGGGSG